MVCSGLALLPQTALVTNERQMLCRDVFSFALNSSLQQVHSGVHLHFTSHCSATSLYFGWCTSSTADSCWLPGVFCGMRAILGYCGVFGTQSVPWRDEGSTGKYQPGVKGYPECIARGIYQRLVFPCAPCLNC